MTSPIPSRGSGPWWPSRSTATLVAAHLRPDAPLSGPTRVAAWIGVPLAELVAVAAATAAGGAAGAVLVAGLATAVGVWLLLPEQPVLVTNLQGALVLVTAGSLQPRGGHRLVRRRHQRHPGRPRRGLRPSPSRRHHRRSVARVARWRCPGLPRRARRRPHRRAGRHRVGGPPPAPAGAGPRPRAVAGRHRRLRVPAPVRGRGVEHLEPRRRASSRSAWRSTAVAATQRARVGLRATSASRCGS